MPSYPHIERYYADLQRLIEYGGSDSELSIRRAFANCLDSYCREHGEKLALVEELPDAHGNRPDGTIKDSMRLARGYWEAKDLRDNLDAEIQNKRARGYPNNNIIYENSRFAVLFQRGEEAMRVDMSDPPKLHQLIQSFLDFVTREVEEFREAWQQFKADMPAILQALREAVRVAANRKDYQEAAASFLELCHRTIGPQVTETDVREMLIQHILTKDIFLRIFSEDQFHQENNVARQLDALAQTFFTGSLRRDTMDNLLPYYGAITGAAASISDYREKQWFLKAIYEDFYKAYNPAAADRLGVVYTPNEIVDFILRGADHLLQRHFGRSLGDKNVQILDPATGTGTFVTNLISYLADSGEPDASERLEHKYLNEIHANEVAILPYYIANLNIEYTYKEKTGRYVEFPNLCFVDTLDNMDWQGATGGAVERQASFNLGAITEENWMRVKGQNEKTISVIIGNPPYNANQQNENDNNKNRAYPEIDKRISDTYILASSAQKTKQYDMYKRFIRWASDRLADDGIIAFITNRAYIDTRQDDGFRKVAAEEFSDIYLLDLGSDVRRNPRISGTSHNVFGIQTGVAIGFFVRDKSRLGECSIHYARREDAELARDKLAHLRDAKLSEIEFSEISPDSKSNWLNQSNSEFDRLLPLANRQTKYADFAKDERAVFKLYSQGVVTARDDWTYEFESSQLQEKIQEFAASYEEIRLEFGGKDFEDDQIGKRIKWTRDLKGRLRQNKPIEFNVADIRRTVYRPFVPKFLYYAPEFNEMQYQMRRIFPRRVKDNNVVICFSGFSSTKPFQVLATDKVFGFDTLEKTQCLPLYRYSGKGRRSRNITTWGIQHISDHYKKEWGEDFKEIYPGGITAEHIFAYTYAVLHDPVYRHDYTIDLTRELPRLPLYHDFDVWARMGQELLDLHIGFESAEPYALQQIDQFGHARRVILRADKDKGWIVLDDKTTLTGVPPDAWRYRLGNRSALEWVLDQYKERKPRDPTIAEKFNTYRFADYKEHVIDLLRRVCTVSVRTMEIVDGMAYWDDEGNLVVFGDRDKHEWAMLGMSQWVNEPEDPEWEAAWLET